MSISVAQPGIPLRLSQFFFENDVVLSPEQARLLLRSLLDSVRRKKRSAPIEKVLRRRKRKMYRRDRAHWRVNPIPYVVNPSLCESAAWPY